jgi:hypothetical protein
VSGGWVKLDLTRPMGHAREVAGLTPAEARTALGLPDTPGSLSTVWSTELNERKAPPVLPQLGKLLARLKAYGLEIEIRVRRKR